MIISSSILNGFQQNITNKIIGFGNHIQLSKIQNNSTFNKPIEINQDLEKKILDIKNINKIYPFAYKTGIINNNARAKLAAVLDNGLSCPWPKIE